MEKEIAFIGNWPELRRVYFRMRWFVIQKIIDRSRISEIDTSYLVGKITYNSVWSHDNAMFVYAFLKKFQNELNQNDVKLLDFSTYMSSTASNSKNNTSGSSGRQVSYSGGKFVVTFPYDPDLVNQIKKAISAGSREWVAKDRKWLVNLSEKEALLSFAEANGFQIGEMASKHIHSGGIDQNLIEESYSSARVELNIPLKKTLFDFQTVGAAYAIRIAKEIPGAGALIADQMGLGKTPQGITYTMGMEQWPTIVICPKALMFNWKNEYEAWTDKKAVIISEKVINRIGSMVEAGICHVVICNFDGLKKYFVQEIKKTETKDGKKRSTVILNNKISHFKNIVIDEAHELKNQKIDRYRIVRKICETIGPKVLLTGTPIVNEINDMASLLELSGHIKEFGGRWEFNKKFENIGKDSFEGNKKIPALLELNRKLRSTCMIRREKHMVLQELPDKIRQRHEVEIDNRKEYDHAFLSLQDWMAANGANKDKIEKSLQAEFMVKLGVLKRLSAKGKVSSLVEWANSELFPNKQKLVVFAWHREILLELKKHFPKMDIVDGTISDPKLVQNAVDRFQKEDFESCPVIGLTYKKGGVGLTLTASSNWACLEHPWHDAILSQAEDRIHRIGQKDTAFCHHFFGVDTIDQQLYAIVEYKREMSKQVTGSTEEISEQVVGSLWKLFNK